MNRDRRKEEVEKAYQIQVEAGLRGAAQYGAVGLGLAAIAHHSWPAFRCVRLPGCPRARRADPPGLCALTSACSGRRQTLPFKAWLVCIGACAPPCPSPHATPDSETRPPSFPPFTPSRPSPPFPGPRNLGAGPTRRPRRPQWACSACASTPRTRCRRTSSSSACARTASAARRGSTSRAAGSSRPRRRSPNGRQSVHGLLLLLLLQPPRRTSSRPDDSVYCH